MSRVQSAKQEGPGLTIERLLRVLEAIQVQIRAFDAKAQIVMAAAGVLAMAYSVNASRFAQPLMTQTTWTFISWAILVVAGMGFAAFFISLSQAFMTLNPRTELNQPQSMLFFGHISAQYKTEYERFFQQVSAMSEEELMRDLSNQILANSNVCNLKCKHVRRALKFLTASFVLWLVVFLLGLQYAA